MSNNIWRQRLQVIYERCRSWHTSMSAIATDIARLQLEADKEAEAAPPAHAGGGEVGTVAHDYHRLCAASWKALGITEYTGRSIPEEIELLRARLTPSASAPVEVTKEMVERAIHELDFTAPESREHMRRALTAALKGKP